VITLRHPVACIALLLIACGGAVPQPSAKPHPARAYEVVPYPPPSALVEIVPEQPHAEAVWVDGYWVWRGRYYVWERGGWVRPPNKASVAKSHARYRDDGTLLFAPTRWYDEHGRIIEPPPFLLPAATPPTEETAEPTTIP
jgi:hypothetical protein